MGEFTGKIEGLGIHNILVGNFQLSVGKLQLPTRVLFQPITGVYNVFPVKRQMYVLFSLFNLLLLLLLLLMMMVMLILL